jgi:hypothetical protein
MEAFDSSREIAGAMQPSNQTKMDSIFSSDSLVPFLVKRAALAATASEIQEIAAGQSSGTACSNAAFTWP